MIIDTPPLAQAEAAEAVRKADLILIPCRPAAFDLHAVRMTARMAQTANKPAFVMFNGGPPNAPNIYGQAAELVQQIGLAVAPVRLSDRAAYRGDQHRPGSPGDRASRQSGRRGKRTMAMAS